MLNDDPLRQPTTHLNTDPYRDRSDFEDFVNSQHPAQYTPRPNLSIADSA